METATENNQSFSSQADPKQPVDIWERKAPYRIRAVFDGTATSWILARGESEVKAVEGYCALKKWTPAPTDKKGEWSLSAELIDPDTGLKRIGKGTLVIERIKTEPTV